MTAISECDLPQAALLRKYVGPLAHVDCYTTEMPGIVSHPEYVEAFYTTAVFKLERAILSAAVSRPSTDAQAADLAQGKIESFAAWSVEARAPNQLLLCDMHGRTRSWLMAEPVAGGTATRLYFGSAVVPVINKQSGKATLGPVYRALLGFHKIYSRALLGAAVKRIKAGKGE